MNCEQCGNQINIGRKITRFCDTICRSAHRRANLGICRVEECGEKAVVSGERLCHFHYRRFQAGLSLTNVRFMARRGHGTFDKCGYIVVRINGKNYFQHRLVVERAMGKLLPITAHVHHLNGIKYDNRQQNLVVCPNDEYHRLLHRRAKELGIVFE